METNMALDNCIEQGFVLHVTELLIDLLRTIYNEILNQSCKLSIPLESFSIGFEQVKNT